ncbi:DUF559 domain-containing protein [Luteimicrobium subarcticum]|uniref:Very-short-patch-repair endonuclease n=1 Tax=Luteimicrobium subarcticum TaxID=620910 RepID=A0A2M8WT14_9MICO|nr:DUF559 domain-containing protein [Luteimicrobium subarcticum]PJI94059.1 very-short-patch-repair endonuclease [Luteimicrobium subarcticum]
MTPQPPVPPVPPAPPVPSVPRYRSVGGDTGSVLTRLQQHRVLRLGSLVSDASGLAALRALVRTGQVDRVGHGTYAMPGTPDELVLAARFRGLVTCASAVRLHRLATHGPPDHESPERVHLAVAGGSSGGSHPARDRARVRLYRGEPVEVSSVHVPGPVVPVAVALVTCAVRDSAVVSVDSAVQRGFVTVEEVAARVAPHAAARAAVVLGLVDGRSESVIETLARLALVDAGFAVVPQVVVPGVGRVDLLVEGTVVVELDGFAYHGDRSAYREDRRRDRELVARGLTVLRFTYEDVVQGPARVVDAVRAALVARA